MEHETLHDLRDRRQRAVNDARKLVDNWKADSQPAYNSLLAEIDALDREIRGRLDGVQREAEARHGTAPVAMTDAGTGRPIPIAYAGRGSVRSQYAAHGYSASGPDLSMAEFLRGIAGGKASEGVRAALSEGVDTAGGHMLPTALQLRLLEALVPASSLLSAGTGLATLDAGAKSYKVAALATIPTAAWRNEAATIATSEPTFRGIDIVPRSLSFQFKVSRELLADAVGIDQALMIAIAQAFAKELDRAGLRGSGTAPEIRGLLNTVGVQAVTNGTNGASLATTAYANHVAAVQALLAADAPMPTAAIMAPRSLTTLGGLLDTTNQPRGVPPMLAGVRMIATSQIPVNLTVGTSTDASEIYVSDFTRCAFFMRERMTIQKLVELHAGTGEIGFVGHVRADFAALFPAAVAIVTGVRA